MPHNTPIVPLALNPFTADDFDRLKDVTPKLKDARALCEALMETGIDVSNQLSVCASLENLFEGVQARFGNATADPSLDQ